MMKLVVVVSLSVLAYAPNEAGAQLRTEDSSWQLFPGDSSAAGRPAELFPPRTVGEHAALGALVGAASGALLLGGLSIACEIRHPGYCDHRGEWVYAIAFSVVGGSIGGAAGFIVGSVRSWAAAAYPS